jgi:hypothetical protein
MAHAQSPQSPNIGKKALVTYSFLALLVYIIAVVYCYLTIHFFEMYLVSAVVLALTVFVAVLYRAMVKPNKN